MSAPRLPAVRLTEDGDCVIQEGFSLDFPPSNKFSVSYAPSEGRRNSVLETTHSQQEEHLALSGSDGEQHTSDGDSGDDMDSPPHYPSTSSPSLPTSSPYVRVRSFLDKPAPNISRTLSAPLPSQLSHLQHPHRLSQSSPSYSPPVVSSSQVHEVSMELADSIQLVIQTMLQISPPQVLDPAKEQFSACSLSVPTSSMSAMFTAMKNINYISANMSTFCEQVTSRVEETLAPRPSSEQRNMHNEFDIGEMLQCVGDALSGSAAQAGVDLVLYHGDVGLKHVYVSGDESGISFALSHIIRQVLSTAERGDSIELGLLVCPLSNASIGLNPDLVTESPPIDDMLTAAPLASNGPVRVKIRISHKYAPSETHQGADHPKDVVTTEIRVKPFFSTLLLRRILKQIDGTLVSDLPPPEAFTSGRTCDLEMTLDRVPVPMQPSVQEDLHEGGVQTEATLELLSSFGETLKGKKVTLYASAKGSFAHHLTSYLTAWGMDVNHVSPDGQVDGLTDQLSSLQDEARQSSYNPVLATYAEDPLPGSSTKPDPRPTVPSPPNFIFIDDDVDILKERLQALRFENQPQAHLSNARKRPSLSTHHRPRSSPQMTRLMGFNNLSPPTPVVIMHFTSLANYKLVRDVVQSVMVSYSATSTPLPEVMIIPKPAGPRRFLTALYTAVTKPVVDPWFLPIATSPMSPSVPHSRGSFFSSPIGDIGEHEGPNSGNDHHSFSSQKDSPSIKNGNRPLGSRSNSDRSTRSNENATNLSSLLPPSPLALPDNVEYFSAAAERLGTSPSSGLVIQSPNGQTAGIYFHPRSRNGFKNPSSQSMERDRGQLVVPSPRRPTPRVPSGSKKEDNVLFATLHEVGAQSKSDPGGETTQPSPSASSLSRILSVGPVEDQREQPSLASSILSPVPRRASDDVRKLATPSRTPTEGTPSGRRTGKRAESKDSSSGSAKQKGKSATSSDNVVPPISVLIVDDNPINQTILSTFMRRKRIKYELASNGQEAVQKWRTGGFHLILMDIQMPVMDGIQATKEIRRLEKSNAAAGYPPLSPASTDEGHTPSDKSVPSGASSATSETRSLNSPYRSSVIIVALTASSLQSDRVAALAAGCNDFLTKPVSLLWLNNKIIEWGSIKALQMWADIRPDGLRSMTNGQAAQARNVAERLHVPVQKGRTPPPPSASPVTRRLTSILEDNAAAIALASPAGSIPNFASGGPIPPRPPSTSTSGQPSKSLSPDASAVRDVLENHPLKRKSLESEDDTPKPSTPQSRAMQRDTTFSQSRSVTPIQQASEPEPELPLNASDISPTSASVKSSVKTRENGHIRPPEEESSDPSSDANLPAQETEIIHSPPPSP